MALDRDYGRHTPDIDGGRKRKSTMSTYIDHKRVKPESDAEIDEIEETSEQIAKQYKKYEYAPKYNLNSEELYCICRRPDSGELMILCDGCEEWFHFKCMRINKLYSNLVAKFYCKFCKWKDLGETKWKRKCRLEYCYEPIRPDSKYCCDEHGNEYMRQTLIQRDRNRNDISVNIINDILIHVDDDYEKLKELGKKFPELQEVEQFKQDGTGSIPELLKLKLNSINQKLSVVEHLIELYKSKVKNLTKVREKIKVINDKLSIQIDEKKPKKIDICCYDRNLELSNDIELIQQLSSELDNDIFQQFKKVIQDRILDEEDIPDWFEDKICTQDRKRCIRHNGWWNLINDEFTKKLNQLDIDLDVLQQEKEEVFKDYSIKIYESLEKLKQIESAISTGPQEIEGTREAKNVLENETLNGNRTLEHQIILENPESTFEENNIVSEESTLKEEKQENNSSNMNCLTEPKIEETAGIEEVTKSEE
jgi:COMPASS component SPP1